jgi:hypothetical protein
MEKTNLNISKQVKIWDWFSRIVPSLFIAISSIVIYFDHEQIRTIFLVGIILFFSTCIIWWYWTLDTILKLNNVLNIADKNLDDILQELRKVKNDIKIDSNR